MLRRMRMSYLVPLLLLATILGAAEPDQILGADAIVAALSAPAAKVSANAAARPTQVEVDAFAAQPEHTAAAWLALASRWNGSRDEASATIDRLLAALPAPAQWPALRIGLADLGKPGVGKVSRSAKQQAAGWNLLATALSPERGPREQALKAAQAVLDPNDEWTLRGVRELLIDGEDDPTLTLQAVEKQLAIASQSDHPNVVLPDLVALLNEEKALPMVRAALVLPFSDFEVRGTRTRALATREALALIDALKAAPWSLITGAESLALFEALEKRFPAQPKNRNPWQRQQAEARYLTQLIAAGRTADALKRIESVGDKKDALLSRLPLNELAENRPVELTNTIRDLLKKEPQRPLWNLYAQLAAQLGRADEIKTMVHTYGNEAAKQGQLVNLLLAADELEPAIAALRAGLVPPPAVPKVELKNDQPKQAEANPEVVPGDVAADDGMPDEIRDGMPSSARTCAQRLLVLGTVLERQDLVTEAVQAFGRLPAEASSQWGSDGWMRTHLLQRAGYAGLAEKLLLEELKLPPANRWEQGHPMALSCLVRLYHALGRHADVVTLVSKVDQWGAADLREVASGYDSHEGIPPLAAIVGDSFASVGKVDEAHRCALLALDQAPTSDAGYALLLKLDGAQAKPLLERLRRRDILEERPVLWLAQVALDAGALPEAERLAREAIAIDPSDGDQGPGDRMRDRAILAVVLERLGRNDEATPLRTALAAIRQGERADVFLRAGLAVRAAEGYIASEKILDRTYCVQSRLAVTLAKLGRNEEAAVHFRRAFELMPKAFGRRESHCFGCEGVFSGVDARKIADQVFTAMVASDPKNPRHQYLLGYLRAEQEHYAEAAASFRAAIQLDPDYYSAIEQLLRLDEHLRLPRAERQALIFSLARMDPGTQHSDWQIEQVSDLAALYNVLAVNADALCVAPEKIIALTLPAKATADEGRNVRSSQFGSANMHSLGVVMASHPLLQAAGQLIDRDW